MSYAVTFRGATDRKSPYAVDECGSDLKGTLAHACKLLSEGKLEVAIQDGSGKQIAGEVLAACCRGEKEISTDLFSR